MRREMIESAVDGVDVFDGLDIKEVTKEAKIGWLKALIIAAAWPLLKEVLLKRVNAKLVQVVEVVLNSI